MQYPYHDVHHRTHYPGYTTTASACPADLGTPSARVTVPSVSSPGSFWYQGEVSKIVHFRGPLSDLKSIKTLKLTVFSDLILRSQTLNVSKRADFL